MRNSLIERWVARSARVGVRKRSAAPARPTPVDAVNRKSLAYLKNGRNVL